MRAIIDATRSPPALATLLENRPAALVRIGDKPLIHHLIDQLIGLGVNQIDLIAHDHPEQIKSAVGDGIRWGIAIHHHLCKDPASPFKTFHSDYSGPLVIGRADSIPVLNASQLSNAPSAYMEDSGHWSGWAFLPAQNSRDLWELPESLPKSPMDFLFKLEDAQRLVDQNIRQLNSASPALMMPSSAKQVEPGLWISRGVVLDPHARLTPPVFLGEHCHVYANSEIGPNAIIENGTVISNASSVRNSLICQNSFVGEGVDIHDSVVDGSRLLNFRYNSEVRLFDDFILSHLHAEHITDRLWRLSGMLAGLILCIACLPIISLLCVFFPPSQHNMQRTGYGDGKGSYTLWTFNLPDHWLGARLINRLAALINLVRGEIRLVGMSPISVKQFDAMPESWKPMIAQAPQGWLTILDLENHQPTSRESWQASQAYYAAQSGWRFDFRLIWNWCKHKCGLRRYV